MENLGQEPAGKVMAVTRYHFISGLPEAGAGRLVRVLRQNPGFVTGSGTPAAALHDEMVARMADRDAPEARLDAQQQTALLRGILEAVYHDRPMEAVVFDSNSGWLNSIERLAQLFPLSRFIVMVRNSDDLVVSVRSGDDAHSLAIRALRAALEGPAAERILVIEHDRLIADPMIVVDVLYHFLREPEFDHDFRVLDGDREADADAESGPGTPAGQHFAAQSGEHAPAAATGRRIRLRRHGARTEPPLAHSG